MGNTPLNCCSKEDSKPARPLKGATIQEIDKKEEPMIEETKIEEPKIEEPKKEETRKGLISQIRDLEEEKIELPVIAV